MHAGRWKYGATHRRDLVHWTARTNHFKLSLSGHIACTNSHPSLHPTSPLWLSGYDCSHTGYVCVNYTIFAFKGIRTHGRHLIAIIIRSGTVTGAIAIAPACVAQQLSLGALHAALIAIQKQLAGAIGDLAATRSENRRLKDRMRRLEEAMAIRHMRSASPLATSSLTRSAGSGSSTVQRLPPGPPRSAPCSASSSSGPLGPGFELELVIDDYKKEFPLVSSPARAHAAAAFASSSSLVSTSPCAVASSSRESASGAASTSATDSAPRACSHASRRALICETVLQLLCHMGSGSHSSSMATPEPLRHSEILESRDQ